MDFNWRHKFGQSRSYATNRGSSIYHVITFGVSVVMVMVMKLALKLFICFGSSWLPLALRSDLEVDMILLNTNSGYCLSGVERSVMPVFISPPYLEQQLMSSGEGEDVTRNLMHVYCFSLRPNVKKMKNLKKLNFPKPKAPILSGL